MVPAHSLAVLNTATNHQVNLAVAIGQWWNGGGSLGAGGPGIPPPAPPTGAMLRRQPPPGGRIPWPSSGAPQAPSRSADPQPRRSQGGVPHHQATPSPATHRVGGFTRQPTVTVKVEERRTGGGTATIASVLSGSAGLDKTGRHLVLSGTNTYSGGTTIAAGTLQIGDGGTAGSVLGNHRRQRRPGVQPLDAVTFAGVISGTGTLDKQGARAPCPHGGQYLHRRDDRHRRHLQLNGGASLAGMSTSAPAPPWPGIPPGRHQQRGRHRHRATTADPGRVSAASAVSITSAATSPSPRARHRPSPWRRPHGQAAFAVAGNLGLDGTVDLTAGRPSTAAPTAVRLHGTLSGAGLTLGTTPAQACSPSTRPRTIR